MGTLKAVEIAEKLTIYGRQPSVSIAVTPSGILSYQIMWAGRLKDLGLLVAEAERLALMVIDEVITLRNETKWFKEDIEHFERTV